MFAIDYLRGNKPIEDRIVYKGDIYFKDFIDQHSQRQNLNPIYLNHNNYKIEILFNNLFETPLFVVESEKFKEKDQLFLIDCVLRQNKKIVFKEIGVEHEDFGKKSTILEEKQPTRTNSEKYFKYWLEKNNIEVGDSYDLLLRCLLDYVVQYSPSLVELNDAIEFLVLGCNGEEFNSFEWIKFTNKIKNEPVFLHKAFFDHLSIGNRITKTEIIKNIEELESRGWDDRKIIDLIFSTLRDLLAINKQISQDKGNMDSSKYNKLQRYVGLDVTKIIKYLILVASIEPELKITRITTVLEKYV